MGFNSGFKGLSKPTTVFEVYEYEMLWFLDWDCQYELRCGL